MLKTTQLVELLGQVAHFKEMTPDDLRAIVEVGTILRYASEQVIFLENEPCAGLFVLLEGRVQLCKLSPAGQVSILSIFEPVMMFNEVAALDQGPNPLTVVAVEDSQVWNMPAPALEELLLRDSRLCLRLLRLLAGRNRRLVTQFEDLSFRPVLARSAKLLLELSQDGQSSIDRRKHRNYQLAARIATVPEAFSRSLRVFRQAGAIDCTAERIDIQDPNQLRRAAQVGPS